MRQGERRRAGPNGPGAPLLLDVYASKQTHALGGTRDGAHGVVHPSGQHTLRFNESRRPSALSARDHMHSMDSALA